MPKDDFLKRYHLIIKRLEKSPASYEQINRFLEDKSNVKAGVSYAISKRTLQRDIKDISRLFNIDIVNEKREDNRYSIYSKLEENDNSQRLLEAYELTRIIESATHFEKYVLPEKRKQSGLEHFFELLHAVKNKQVVSVTYKKFSEETSYTRTLHPLALKEFKERWYLIAVDPKDNLIKSFGLDRISGIDVKKAKIREIREVDVAKFFNDYFGIITDADAKPETIVLTASKLHGHYIRSYPLHHSQKVLQETTDQVVFALNLVPTYDFIMELLSYGKEVCVKSPESLVKSIKKNISDTLRMYE